MAKSQVKRMGLFAHIFVIMYAAFTLVACDILGEILSEILSIPVEDITAVPSTAIVNNPLTLTGTVKPELANKKDIIWTMKSGPATISGNTLTAHAAGTVTVTATIIEGVSSATDSTVAQDFTKDFSITASFMPVTAITGVPTTATIGMFLPLTGTVTPSNASNKAITWSVKSGPAVVNGNTLNPIGAGQVVVTATITNGASASTDFIQDFPILVNNDFVSVTDISGVPATADVGVPLALSGTVAPANATNKTISWSVKSGSATISGNTLTASAAGTVVVTATINGGLNPTTKFDKDFEITINSVPVTNIINVPTTASVGYPLTLTGTVIPENASNKAISWSVKSGPAAINGNTLTPTGAGTVVVTATVVNGLTTGDYTNDFNITVSDDFVAVTNIDNVPVTATINVPLTLSGRVTPADATYQTITWTRKSGVAATINGNSLTATAAGTVVVTATITNGTSAASNYTKDFEITVNIVPVTGITGVTTTTTVGTPLALAGTVTPENATNKAITWNVKSGSATLSGNSLTAAAAGTVVVTATITNGASATTPFTQDFTITVNIVPVSDITGVPNAATVNEPLTLTGTVMPSNATNKTITWTRKSGVEANIAGNILTASEAGTVTVTATIINGATAATNYTKDFTITVNEAFVPVTDIGGVPTMAIINVPLTLSGTAAPPNATNQNITWTRKSGTATLSGNSLTATAAGTVVVTATITNGASATTNFSRDFNITVFVPVTNIDGVVPTAATVGHSITLPSTVTPSNATNQTITWTRKSGSATIEGYSLTPTAAGPIVVTATVVNGLTAATNFTKDFTITASNPFVAVTGINDVPTSVIVGTSLTLTGTVMPENATNRTITWARKSGVAATVTGNSLTSNTVGDVVVTATIVNGATAASNYTKDFTIKVQPVPVTDITGVPTTATVGTALTLTGTVAPSNATNKTITWARKSGVAGNITNGNLTATAVGDIIVTATITNGVAIGSSYTKDFTITVQPVPVTDITGVPTTATVGVALNLSTGTAVAPTNATYKTIAWSVASAGTTGATVSGNTLSTTGTGTVTVTATITNGKATGTNYTQNFTITVQPETVAFNNLTANGSSNGTATTTTTQLTLTFAKNITDLTAADITLNAGTTGAVKGELTKPSGTGIYYLAVSGITSGGTVTATVTNPNYTFNPASRTVTVHARGTLTPLTITFNQIADNAPSITGPTLYRVSNNGPTTATITLDNSTQYDSISWRVQNTTVTGTGPSFTLSAGNLAYNLIGEHFVTVMVMKGGVPYNKTVSFKVEY